MNVISPVISKLARMRLWRVKNWTNHPVESQRQALQDLVTTSSIYYDPRDEATLIAEDTEWLAYFAAYETAIQPAGSTPVKKSAWLLRFELDREKMFTKNISMDRSGNHKIVSLQKVYFLLFRH
jgi:hypothetical protein